MPTKKEQSGLQSDWQELVGLFRDKTPHLYSVLDDERDFIELKVMMRPDGTCLAILKRYDGSGGPVVCFGGGYGFAAALMAINKTVAAGSWREDKPWKHPNGSEGGREA